MNELVSSKIIHLWLRPHELNIVFNIIVCVHNQVSIGGIYNRSHSKVYRYVKVVAFDIKYVSSFDNLPLQISCLLNMRIDNAEFTRASASRSPRPFATTPMSVAASPARMRLTPPRSMPRDCASRRSSSTTPASSTTRS